MNRVCIEKITKKIIEMQSGGKIGRKDIMEWSLSIKNPEDRIEEKYQEYLAECDALEAMRLNTLKQNALNAGYKEDEVEVKRVTDAEYKAAKAEDPNEIARIAEIAAKEVIQLAKTQAFIDNLPAWQTVSNALDDIKADAQAATTIAALKAVVIGLIFFIKKLTRVVYILAREQ